MTTCPSCARPAEPTRVGQYQVEAHWCVDCNLVILPRHNASDAEILDFPRSSADRLEQEEVSAGNCLFPLGDGEVRVQ